MSRAPNTIEVASPEILTPASRVRRTGAHLKAVVQPITADRSEDEALRSHITQQVFASGVHALPLVCMVAFGTGAAIVLQTTMAPTPPSGEFGRMLVVVVLRELAPLLTAILVAGQSGPVLVSELAQQTRGHRARIVGVAIATAVLAIYFAAVSMAGSYLVSSALTLRTLDAVHTGVQQELAWFDMPLFALKAAGLGALIGFFARRSAGSPIGSTELARHSSRAFSRLLVYGTVYSIALTLLLYGIIGAPAPP